MYYCHLFVWIKKPTHLTSQANPALEWTLHKQPYGGPSHEHLPKTGFFSVVRIAMKILWLIWNQSWSGLGVAYEYLLYVKCCHLMLVTVVNVKTENLASVAHEFENFNNWILQIQLFLREHEENYYLKCGIRVRMWTLFYEIKTTVGPSFFLACTHLSYIGWAGSNNESASLRKYQEGAGGRHSC